MKLVLKAEKILSHGDILLDRSEEEIFQIVRSELAEKIVKKMIDEGLVKIEIINTVHDDFGALVKVRASTRVYNPDD